MSSKGPGYTDASIVGCQFSVYPLRQMDVDTPVQEVIKAAAQHCPVKVGNLSTLLWGDEDKGFQALRSAFHAAQAHGPAVLTATFASGMPSDELVADIQADIEAVTGGRA